MRSIYNNRPREGQAGVSLDTPAFRAFFVNRFLIYPKTIPVSDGCDDPQHPLRLF